MMFPQVGETKPCIRHHAVSLLLANSPHLLHFFFTEDRLALRWGDGSGTLSVAEQHLDDGEVTLVRFALDIWQQTALTTIADIYRELTSEAFYDLTAALRLLLVGRGCGCPNCRQRLSDVLGVRMTFPQTF